MFKQFLFIFISSSILSLTAFDNFVASFSLGYATADLVKTYTTDVSSLEQDEAACMQLVNDAAGCILGAGGYVAHQTLEKLCITPIDSRLSANKIYFRLWNHRMFKILCVRAMFCMTEKVAARVADEFGYAPVRLCRANLDTAIVEPNPEYARLVNVGTHHAKLGMVLGWHVVASLCQAKFFKKVLGNK